MQKILSSLRRAVDEYKLIEEGDKIAVGVSGGKDSLVLLKGLCLYKKFAPYHFDIVAVTVDLRAGKSDFTKISELCHELGCEYHIIPSDIYEIVFEIRKETNPCSLCAKLRRGMLNTKALELGCNKLALGHSADDVIHTFFLSMFYEGRLSTFLPKIFMDRTGMTVIRPLILTDEKLIKKEAKILPVTPSNCPVDKHTKREDVKKLINQINTQIPIAKDRIFTALTHPERYNLFDKAYNNDSFCAKNPTQKEEK